MDYLARYESLKDMRCTITIKTELMGEIDTKRTFFAMKKPSKYRTEDENIIRIVNGDKITVYNKNTGSIKVSDNREINNNRFEMDYGSFVNNILEKNKAEYVGDEEIENRNCLVFILTPKEEEEIETPEIETPEIEQKIWVDKEFWYPLKIEIENMILEYTDLEFNSGLSDDIFELDTQSDKGCITRKF